MARAQHVFYFRDGAQYLSRRFLPSARIKFACAREKESRPPACLVFLSSFFLPGRREKRENDGRARRALVKQFSVNNQVAFFTHTRSGLLYFFESCDFLLYMRQHEVISVYGIISRVP